jgi:hypothetical protein
VEKSGGDLRTWASVLRAVLCHMPKSCPPERAFSILNGCVDDGKYNAFADYKETWWWPSTTLAGAH